MTANYFTILYWFCHTSTWIRHGCTRVPHPESPSLHPPRTIPLGRPSAPGPSNQYHASNLDWRFISHMIFHMFQCHSPISSHPRPLPQSPKDCSIHLCLFCCLAYRVMVQFSCSVMSDSVTPWTAAYQAPPSIGFSRQEYWSGVPLPSLPIQYTKAYVWNLEIW